MCTACPCACACIFAKPSPASEGTVVRSWAIFCVPIQRMLERAVLTGDLPPSLGAPTAADHDAVRTGQGAAYEMKFEM